MSEMTLGDATFFIKGFLTFNFPDTATQETRLLLCHVLRCDPAELYKNPERLLTDAEEDQLEVLLERRLDGVPLAYLLGEQGFYGTLFRVTRDVLIPRADTELLVDRALALLPENTSLQVVDLGTGSGAIAVTLARLRPHWQLLAVDCKEAALTVAKGNAESHGVRNVVFVENDWLEGVTQEFDAIVSNPPYVSAEDAHLMPEVILNEPLVATVAGENGLRCLRVITEQAGERLKPGGWLVFEHGFQQGESVRNLMAAAGFEKIQTHRDLAGHERVTEGRKPCQIKKS
jgi:release factor glutamine methyltransferase